ncbi:transglutaminase-like domain-containing protein [Methanobacterium sp.]|uniref:transglutaminase-like domain-containing protein n=1 Tax=Methanobacterium sp. TaxID=2164 RepID=UPI003C70A420
MLVTAMLLTGIAGVSAANVGHAEKKLNYTHIVPEKISYQIIEINGTKKSDKNQNKSDKISKYAKKTIKNKHIVAPNKNTVKHKIHKKHLIHSKKLTKTNNTVYHKTTNSTTNKSIKTVKTLKQNVTANSTKNTTINSKKLYAFENQRFSGLAEQDFAAGKMENFSMQQTKNLQAAAGEPKKIKKTSRTTGKYLAAGSPSTVKIPKYLRKYLKATKNCQVNNARIKSLAKQITRGKKTRLGKAVAIFKWVRDRVGYKFYYNTRKGAVGTLRSRSGNCVDTAHLLIALERAAGIPARYVHG